MNYMNNKTENLRETLNIYYKQKVTSLSYNETYNYFIAEFENHKKYVLYYFDSLKEKLKQDLKNYKNSSLDIPYDIWSFIVKNIHEDKDFIKTISSVIDGNQSKTFERALDISNINLSDREYKVKEKQIKNFILKEHLRNIEKGKLFWEFVNKKDKDLYSLCIFYSTILLGIDNIVEDLTEYLIDLGNIGVIEIKKEKAELYILPTS